MVVTQHFIDHALICPVGSTKEKAVIPSLLHSLLLVRAQGHTDQLMCSMSPEKPLSVLGIEVKPLYFQHRPVLPLSRTRVWSNGWG